MTDLARYKIDYALSLARRIHNEMQSGSIESALYLTDAFVFLFSDNQAAVNELINSYRDMTHRLLHKGEMEQAKALILKALSVEPDNPHLLTILTDIKNRQQYALQEPERSRLEKITYEFIKRHCPEELPYFELAWRVFKDISPESFMQGFASGYASGALGIVGYETSDLNTPKVIILLSQIRRENMQSISLGELQKTVQKIGLEIGSPQELNDKITEFIFHNLDKFTRIS